jgi:SET domain
MGSGTSAFYNTAKQDDANTEMKRYFDEDRFEIFATRDIEADEELTHTYISLTWRTCFKDINELLHKDGSSE